MERGSHQLDRQAATAAPNLHLADFNLADFNLADFNSADFRRLSSNVCSILRQTSPSFKCSAQRCGRDSGSTGE